MENGSLHGHGMEPNPSNSGYYAVNTEDGRQVEICGLCDLRWGADRRTLVIFSDVFFNGLEKIYFIPLPPGEDLPHLPPHGLSSADFAALKPKFIGAPALPSPDGKGYLFSRIEQHRNLFRIPLQ